MKRTVQGFALPTLMVMLAIASIATLLAIRNLWVNNQLLNAEADQLRTQHKAEAVLLVALADLLGAATNNDGSQNMRHIPGDATQKHAFFPSTLTEYDLLRQRLNANMCSAGICAPHVLNTTKANDWQAQIPTAATVRATDIPYGDNTAWYWIEVFPQTNTDTFVYRITALANGMMPNSRTVLQAVWARHNHASQTGQWYSWHVLHD
jgi:Tfp pilus assembly protein PilX